MIGDYSRDVDPYRAPPVRSQYLSEGAPSFRILKERCNLRTALAEGGGFEISPNQKPRPLSQKPRKKDGAPAVIFSSRSGAQTDIMRKLYCSNNVTCRMSAISRLCRRVAPMTANTVNDSSAVRGTNIR